MKTSARRQAQYAQALRLVEQLPSPRDMAAQLIDAYGSQLHVAQISGIAQCTLARICNGTRTRLQMQIYLLLLKAFLRFKSGHKEPNVV